jgi:hypothetical protein
MCKKVQHAIEADADANPKEGRKCINARNDA